MLILKKSCAVLLSAFFVSCHLWADNPDNTFKQDPTKDVTAPGANLVSATAVIHGGTVKISFSTTDAPPTQWHHIYLNTDGAGNTGFIHSANSEGGAGMDFLIEPNFLYRWNGGDDQRGWHWDKVQPLEATINDKTVTYEFPASLLNLKPDAKVSVLIETMNDNYGQTLDTLPRSKGIWTIKVDATSDDKTTGAQAPGSAPAIAIPDPKARERFKDIHSYACYYGSGQIDDLSKRDAVIVETRNLKPADVAALKKKEPWLRVI